eukprot:tig00021462_g21575.t1
MADDEVAEPAPELIEPSESTAAPADHALAELLAGIAALRARVARLEAGLAPETGCSAAERDGGVEASDEAPASAASVGEACRALGMRARWATTPEDYYSWPLDVRAGFLRARSPHHLCKTLVMENTRCTNNDCSDPRNSRFYAVIIQYSTRMHPERLMKAVRALKEGKVARQYYNFQFAPPEVAFELTGFAFNGVCPVGMRTKVPIILSEAAAGVEGGAIWLGGGDPYVKVELRVEELVSRLGAFVAPVIY